MAESDSNADKPSFEDIVAECLEQLDHEEPDAVEKACSRYPEHAEQLRSVVGNLVSTGLIDTRDSKTSGEDSFPEQLGEFRLLERIGMGGMGVVYKAKQESLGRLVALKLIRPDYLFFPGARDRLRREVEAVARLDHPGIVSILTFGEEGEIPFFAMEFVHGCSMAQLLHEHEGQDPRTLTGSDMHATVSRLAGLENEHPEAFGVPSLFQETWAQACTRIARQVAEALHHAHHRGIIHRDVKPSNIMLTPDGRALVVDFGLALLQASPKLTRSGSTLGSLAYMAPEQIKGGDADERIDVYSLGISLCEMLTLKPAFLARNAADLQQKILDATFIPPRQANSSVPRDLETVCLTAMCRERSGRYESPAALADDLANVLELRPVHARRPGPVLRAARWVQRHKAVSTAILLAILFTVGTPSMLWLQQRHANTEIEAALEKSRSSLYAARKAIDTMLKRIANSNLAVMPRMTPLRRRVLQDAHALYEELVAADPEEPSLLISLAALECRISYLQQQIGNYKGADLLMANAVRRLRALVDREPTWIHRFELGDTLVYLAGLRMNQRKDKEAMAAVREAITLMEPALEDQNLSQHPPHLRGLTLARMAGAYGQIAAIEIWFPHLRPDDGPWRRDFPALTLKLRQRVLDEYPDHRQAREHLADEHRRHGVELNRIGRYGDALASLRQAVEIYESLDEKSMVAADRNNFALCFGQIAIASARNGNRGEAKRWFRREIEAFRKLVQDYPEYPSFASVLGGALNNLADLQIQERNYEEADKNLLEAIGWQKKALAVMPREAFRAYMRNHLYLRCRLHFILRRFEELLVDARRLPEFDTVKGRGELDAASWILHAAMGFRLDRKRVEKCRVEAVDNLYVARQKGFLKTEYLGADIFRALTGRPRFEALRKGDSKGDNKGGSRPDKDR